MTQMSLAREALAEVSDQLAAFGAMPGMIFGHHGLKTSARKVFCFEHGDSIVFKLPPAAYDAVLALEGTSRFAPRPDRPTMSNWIVVPSAHAREWSELARSAYDHVAGVG